METEKTMETEKRRAWISVNPNMVASDLYALKGLWLKETLLESLKKRKLKNEAKLWVINRPWTP